MIPASRSASTRTSSASAAEAAGVDSAWRARSRGPSVIRISLAVRERNERGRSPPRVTGLVLARKDAGRVSALGVLEPLAGARLAVLLALLLASIAGEEAGALQDA